MDTHDAPQPHNGYLDGEECANVVTSDGEFQRPRSFLGVDKRDGPIKAVTRRVELPFAGVRRHHRIRTSADKYYKVLAKVVKSQNHHLRKRDGDNEVIKGNILVLQLVFDIDIASAIVGRCWPAINFPNRDQKSDVAVECWCTHWRAGHNFRPYPNTSTLTLQVAG